MLLFYKLHDHRPQNIRSGICLQAMEFLIFLHWAIKVLCMHIVAINRPTKKKFQQNVKNNM